MSRLRALLHCTLLAVGCAIVFPRSLEAANGVATVTYVSGSVERQAGGGYAPVAVGGTLAEGDRIRTGAASRTEMKLRDGSLVRLGEKSQFTLQASTFGPKASQRHFSGKLLAGRVWAAVVKLVGADSSFEVSTPNAVAGVRGTRFAAAVEPSGETTVRVYEGTVLVSNRPVYAVEGATKADRVQVAGPQEITRKQWTEMVTSAMQLVRVTAQGEISQPQAFTLADAASDDWEAWNSARDAGRREQ